MFIINGKGNKSVWSAKNKCLLGKFKDGVLETEDEAVAAEFAALGYEVEGDFSPPALDYDAMTDEELAALAVKHGVDTAGKTRKQISAALKKALE